MIIELKTIDSYMFLAATFYFTSMENCNKFKYVFEDHWCNVPWDDPIELPDYYPLSSYWREHINDDPKKLAEDNLMWGFQNCKFNGYDKLTSEQQLLLDSLCNIIVKENKDE